MLQLLFDVTKRFGFYKQPYENIVVYAFSPSPGISSGVPPKPHLESVFPAVIPQLPLLSHIKFDR